MAYVVYPTVLEYLSLQECICLFLKIHYQLLNVRPQPLTCTLLHALFRMVRAHPDEYNFIPKTWILPQEYNSLQNYAKDLKKKKKMKIFIAKPSNGAMGNG